MKKMRKQIGIIILIILIGLGLWYGFKPTTTYDAIIDFYSDRYKDMAKPDYIAQLKAYCAINMSDPIEGLNYSELLVWERRHITYFGPEYDFPRRNMPIEILPPVLVYLRNINGTDLYHGTFTAGRCGEFSLLYTGLCLANEIDVRLIVDESKLTNTSKTGGAGDHMWNEVFVNGIWLHVDPTQNVINDPTLYVRPPSEGGWNKDVNKVYAIGNDPINPVSLVTEKYQ